MATRSAIGIKHGTVIKAVYCHWMVMWNTMVSS